MVSAPPCPGYSFRSVMAGLIWAAAHPGPAAMVLATSSATGIVMSTALRGTVAPGPTPIANEAPKASLRTNQLTRATGQPNVILLDGSDSVDPDGTIAGYEFSISARDTGNVVFGPAATTSPTAEATLGPGDYVATLIVKDNLGALSEPATRGFTLH